MIHSMQRKLIVIAACTFLLFGCAPVQPPLESISESAISGLVADCVAQYYKVDASPYVTQQQHRFIPDSGRLHVTATEPTGPVEYLLQQEQFTDTDRKTAALSDLPESFFNQALATVVFYGMAAGGALLDTQKMISEQPVKIQGQWFKPFIPSWPKNNLSVVLLQNQDTAQFELITISEPSGIKWIARCYNLRYSKELDTRLPRTIDVFDIRNGMASQELIVRFEYKRISAAG